MLWSLPSLGSFLFCRLLTSSGRRRRMREIERARHCECGESSRRRVGYIAAHWEISTQTHSSEKGRKETSEGGSGTAKHMRENAVDLEHAAEVRLARQSRTWQRERRIVERCWQPAASLSVSTSQTPVERTSKPSSVLSDVSETQTCAPVLVVAAHTFPAVVERERELRANAEQQTAPLHAVNVRLNAGAPNVASGKSRCTAPPATVSWKTEPGSCFV